MGIKMHQRLELLTSSLGAMIVVVAPPCVCKREGVLFILIMPCCHHCHWWMQEGILKEILTAQTNAGINLDRVFKLTTVRKV